VIAVIGLLLKAIHSKISAVLRFRVPEAGSAEEERALQAFDRCFWLQGEVIIEKLFPGRTVAARKRIEPKDAHERWAIWLLFVRVSVLLSQLRNFALVVTVCSFAWGAIQAANGHDQSLGEIKAEMTQRVAEMRSNIADLQKQYKEAEDTSQKLVSAYKDRVASANAVTAATDAMLKNRQDVINIQKSRILYLESLLREILTVHKHALEKDGSAGSKAAAESLDKAIKSLPPDPSSSESSAENQNKEVK
jgi:hypothetical protein